MILNRAWFLFYGRMLNMTKREILCTPYGEMCDMISCFAIYNGAKAKQHKKIMDYDDAMALR